MLNQKILERAVKSREKHPHTAPISEWHWSRPQSEELSKERDGGRESRI